jgi:hypothetical protein
MPIKDPEKRREYYRLLMRKRRAGTPSVKRQLEEKLKAERRRVRELEAALAAAKRKKRNSS